MLGLVDIGQGSLKSAMRNFSTVARNEQQQDMMRQNLEAQKQQRTNSTIGTVAGAATQYGLRDAEPVQSVNGVNQQTFNQGANINQLSSFQPEMPINNTPQYNFSEQAMGERLNTVPKANTDPFAGQSNVGLSDVSGKVAEEAAAEVTETAVTKAAEDAVVEAGIESAATDAVTTAAAETAATTAATETAAATLAAETAATTAATTAASSTAGAAGGAAGGAVAGAEAGSALGPYGAVAGLVIGALLA